MQLLVFIIVHLILINVHSDPPHPTSLDPSVVPDAGASASERTDRGSSGPVPHPAAGGERSTGHQQGGSVHHRHNGGLLCPMQR